MLRSIFLQFRKKKTKFLYVYFRVNTNRSEIRARASSLISRRRDDVITITLLQWRHRLRFRIKMIISQFQLFQSFVFLKLITFYHDLIILILFLYNHYVISVLRNGRISVQYEQRLDRDFSAIATRNRNKNIQWNSLNFMKWRNIIWSHSNWMVLRHKYYVTCTGGQYGVIHLTRSVKLHVLRNNYII